MPVIAPKGLSVMDGRYSTTSAVQELQVTVSQAVAKTGHFHQVDMSCGRPLSSRIGDELMTVQVSNVLDAFRVFFCVFEWGLA
jgi:hypothetical protein